MAWQLVIAFGLSLLVGLLAYWRGALSRSGVLGAVLVGTAAFGVGGWEWGVLIILFFVSSTAVSRFRKHQKQTLAAEKFAKGTQRDLWQALANGGVPALIALSTAPQIFGPYLPFIAFMGAVAAATADTWATELGTLAPSQPRLITTGQRVPPGTSGGVTWWGTAASLAAGVFIGGAAGLLFSPAFGVEFAIIGAFSSLAGSLFDSFLGATVQVMYFSEARQEETEKKHDADGQSNRYSRGWRWLNNDMVNVLATVAGALTAVVMFWVSLQF